MNAEPAGAPAATAARAARGPVCPFDLDVQLIDGMLNLELPDHPAYTGLEVQSFDDPRHGRGLLAFLGRRDDGRVDVYRQPGLRLDRETFQVGRGVGRWSESTLDPARLDVGPYGVRAAVRFRDGDGRAVELAVDDRGRRRRRPAGLLAPFGATVTHPTSLLLAYMPRFDLVRSSGGCSVRIDGQEVRTGRLPLARLHRRRLVKYAADIVVVRLNAKRDGDLPAGGDVEPAPDGGIAAIRAAAGDHRIRLALAPPLPDLDRLAAGRPVEGRWDLHVDDLTIGGRWSAGRTGERVELSLDVTRGWSPTGLPPLMRIMTSVVRMFRTWPTTYRWSATVTLGARPSMSSGWERTTRDGDAGYRRLTQRRR